jgi:DNA invertase Pin-like site-specific DNA recombinase
VASGATFTRAGLDGLMADVRKGKIDVVVTYKVDRLGRSLARLAQLIVEFQFHKVALVCPSHRIDTTNSNPAAQLQLNIFMAVAEFEREVTRDRARRETGQTEHVGQTRCGGGCVSRGGRWVL